MRRREFISLLGGAAAWVSPARAQEPRRVIGALGSASSDTPFDAYVVTLDEAGILQSLEESGPYGSAGVERVSEFSHSQDPLRKSAFQSKYGWTKLGS
jgi:hypothetical protein